MLYLGGDKGWVRKELLRVAVGDPVSAPSEPAVVNASAANAVPPQKNGIRGDARRSTAELGKTAFDMKVDYAVKQIQGFLANQQKPAPQGN